MTTKEKAAPLPTRQRKTKTPKPRPEPSSPSEAEEARFMALFEASPIGMALHSIDRKCLATNPAYDRMFGYTGEGFSLEHFVGKSRPAVSKALFSAFDEAARPGAKPVTFDAEFVSATGNQVSAVVTLTHLPESGSSAAQIVAQVVDVTELVDTRRRLEAVQESKSEWLATVSSESPLSALMGLGEILRGPDEEISQTERAGLIETIVESGFEVPNMVEDLLTAARQEAGRLEVVAVPVRFQAQVRQALELIDGHAEVRILGDAPPALADPGRVRQILRNLLSNAFSHGGDDVRVELDSIEGFSRVTVRDNGSGVPHNRSDRVFDAVKRVESGDSGWEGSGIGLSISRQLARRMGGDLVYRRGEEWTYFQLTLPIYRRLPPQPH